MSRRCFSGVHGLRGRAAPPGFHFDEDQDVAISRDQVDFAPERVITARENSHPFSPQKPCRRALALVTKEAIP